MNNLVDLLTLFLNKVNIKISVIKTEDFYYYTITNKNELVVDSLQQDVIFASEYTAKTNAIIKLLNLNDYSKLNLNSEEVKNIILLTDKLSAKLKIELSKEGFDSLDVYQIIGCIENTFNIDII